MRCILAIDIKHGDFFFFRSRRLALKEKQQITLNNKTKKVTKCLIKRKMVLYIIFGGYMGEKSRMSPFHLLPNAFFWYQ